MTSPNSFTGIKKESEAPVPYTGGYSAGEGSGAGYRNMLSYMSGVVHPMGAGLQLAPPVANQEKKSRKREITPAMIDEMNAGRLTMEFNRRPQWLPVNWTLWKVIRTAGRSIGHVDVYYYSPENARLRSKKEVFEHISTDPETICELPEEMAEWHGPTAGVYVMEVSGVRPEKMPLAAPQTVKRVKIKDILSKQF